MIRVIKCLVILACVLNLATIIVISALGLPECGLPQCGMVIQPLPGVNNNTTMCYSKEFLLSCNNHQRLPQPVRTTITSLG